MWTVVGEILFKSAFEKGIEHGFPFLWHHQSLFARLLACRLIYPSREMRISFAALLKIQTDDSYILIRNLHRVDALGPIGGVYKYLHSADPSLDRMSFRPQSIHKDMTKDLRGFLPRKQLFHFLKWFNTGKDRE